jgi:hypothetical protein
LKTLSIINCLLWESYLKYLSQCPNISQLKDLELNGYTLINVTNVSLEPLQVLQERASTIIWDLVFSECGIIGPHITLPALSHCSQLTTFNFCCITPSS